MRRDSVLVGRTEIRDWKKTYASTPRRKLAQAYIAVSGFPSAILLVFQLLGLLPGDQRGLIIQIQGPLRKRLQARACLKAGHDWVPTNILDHLCFCHDTAGVAGAGISGAV